jgi:hypothetical protein
MEHSAAVRETISFNQHCIESKGGYESASNIQLSSKNLDCQSNSGFKTEENTVNLFKDVKSNTVSVNVDQPKIYSDQSDDTSSLVNTPTQHADCLAALRETLSFNQHCYREQKQLCASILFSDVKQKSYLWKAKRRIFWRKQQRQDMGVCSSDVWIQRSEVYGEDD